MSPQVPPSATEHLPPLTNSQRSILDAYRFGQLDEDAFQEAIAGDPVLSDYVRRICRPTDPHSKVH